MKKGKFGIVLPAYAILAFIMVMLGWTIPCGVIVLLAIFVEKDEQTGKLCLEAFAFSIVVSILSSLVTVPYLFTSIPFIGGAISAVFGVLQFIINLAAFILSIWAISRIAKNTEPNLPLVSTLANAAYGIVKPKAISYSVPQQPMQPPVQPPVSAEPQNNEQGNKNN